MIPAEKLKLETAAGFPWDNFGWDRLPEPVLVDLDRLQAQLAANLFDLAAYLAPRELATFQNFAYQKRKIEWLGGRLAAKQAVLQLLGREPAAEAMREWEISADPYGKPFFCSRSGGAPCLSISHSQGLAAAMVAAQMECGLDIQKVSAATVRVKEKFCLAAEEEILASLDLPEPPSFGLTLLWAGKEALRKARGGHPLTGFTAMRLAESVKINTESWLLTMRVADDPYQIPAFFYKDFAMAVCLLPKP